MRNFEECVKEHFKFLDQFGYIISEDSSVDIISFKSKNNQVGVIFSRTEHELTCNFVCGDNQVLLQEGLEYESIEGFKGFYQIANKDDIEKGIVYLAEAVKLLFDRINISEPMNFQKIYQFSIDNRKTSLEKYYLYIDLKMAEDYWKSKEYDKAKELFEKNIDKLSKSQLKKLEFIRNRLK